ncbi:hypothetical protein K505DRAFT_99750 [Melanomma pulvis-pyrius CBS 109.77]|uniref:Uncharacterized protein n=1 Tax=Melanomma pulvis-pyrius CBS 109.77 TaxID=1314802 RepID=A0A6A6WYP9_9PLEO|nr:hypothetical protein K505DRAFT_99750 [Melanomma pulvis-pyrius CBS 109.77]
MLFWSRVRRGQAELYLSRRAAHRPGRTRRQGRCYEYEKSGHHVGMMVVLAMCLAFASQKNIGWNSLAVQHQPRRGRSLLSQKRNYANTDPLPMKSSSASTAFHTMNGFLSSAGPMFFSRSCEPERERERERGGGGWWPPMFSRSCDSQGVRRGPPEGVRN